MQAIKAAAREAFGPDVVVRLFGSRVHDHLKGGDIDLHIEILAAIPDYRIHGRFLDAIELVTDGRKVDTIFSVRGTNPSGMEQIAYRDGVVL